MFLLNNEPINLYNCNGNLNTTIERGKADSVFRVMPSGIGLIDL